MASRPGVSFHNFVPKALTSFECAISKLQTLYCNSACSLLYSSLNFFLYSRYGDTLNPWGDIIAMAKAWCVTKPNAKALIGFPVGPKDKIVFNSHKVYGKIMLPHVFANWKLESTNLDLSKYSDECDWCYEPLFLLSKA